MTRGRRCRDAETCSNRVDLVMKAESPGLQALQVHVNAPDPDDGVRSMGMQENGARRKGLHED